MSTAFHRIIASVRAALDNRAAAPPSHTEPPRSATPVAPDARRVELASQFAREFERLNGDFWGVLSAAEARERVVSLARKLEARSAAIGGGVTMDLAPIAKGLEAAGIAVISPRKVKDSERLEMRASIAKCDLAVVEADYAIAATGTCAVVSAPERPGSLTLLPPVNIILVNTDRILPDLAATIGALGPATVAANRVALISGPSRTADIEKMIVLGVHGPHRLCACAVWNPEGAAPRQ